MEKQSKKSKSLTAQKLLDIIEPILSKNIIKDELYPKEGTNNCCVWVKYYYIIEH